MAIWLGELNNASAREHSSFVAALKLLELSWQLDMLIPGVAVAYPLLCSDHCCVSPFSGDGALFLVAFMRQLDGYLSIIQEFFRPSASV